MSTTSLNPINPKVKKVWRKHLLKLIALILSFALWFYVLNSESQTADVPMRLEFKLPRNKAIANDLNWDVTVKLKGPRSFIRSLNEKNNKIFVDLLDEGSKKSKFTYTLRHDEIPIPIGMQVLEIEPAKIKIILEPRRTKKVDIKANLVGDLPSNLKLQKFELIPNYLVVEGPKSFLAKYDEIKTRPIDISTLEGEDSLRVYLEDIDSRIMGDIPKEGVDFSYVVRPKKANLTLKNVDIFFLSKEQNFTTTTSQVALDVLVPGEGEKSILKSEVKVVAEIPEKVSKNEKIKLKAELPEGVHLLQIHPEYINVSPSKKAKRRRKR